MSIVAANAPDKRRQTAAGPFKVHVMIEFEGQEIHVCEELCQLGIPASKIGGISERTTNVSGRLRHFESESESGAAVVTHGQGPAPDVLPDEKGPVRFVEPDGLGRLESGKRRAEAA